MLHELKIGKYHILCEPKGEIASISVSSEGVLIREFTVSSFYSVIPLVFFDNGQDIQIAISRNCKSYVMKDGTTKTDNWFFNRDFLASAHRALGLRWPHRWLSNSVQFAIDLVFALVMGYVISFTIIGQLTWTTYTYSSGVWLAFTLLMDFGRQIVETRRLKKAFSFQQVGRLLREACLGEKMKIFKDEKGQRISYHDLDGELMPILFIHGLGCASSSDYPEVAGSKYLCNHRRILVDLLGYGYSDKRDTIDYSLVNQANTLVDLINHLRIDYLVIFGHSMGGAVAIQLAEQIKNKVHSLVISEGNLDSGGGPGSRRIADYSVQEYLRTGHVATLEDRRGQGNYYWPASMENSNPSAVHRCAKDLVTGVTPSWRAMFNSFEFPRTYIFGAKNLPDKDEEELKKYGISIGIVSEAGHNMANENASGLAEAIAKGIRT